MGVEPIVSVELTEDKPTDVTVPGAQLALLLLTVEYVFCQLPVKDLISEP